MQDSRQKIKEIMYYIKSSIEKAKNDADALDDKMRDFFLFIDAIEYDFNELEKHLGEIDEQFKK